MSIDAGAGIACEARSENASRLRTLESIPETFRLVVDLWRSEAVSIRMFGDERIHGVYRDFTSGHRLLPWVGKKAFGAALIDLADENVTRARGAGTHQQLRRSLKKASKSYSFRSIHAPDHVDEILAINRSSDHRQGRPIERTYLDEGSVRRIAEIEEMSFGVFDRDGVLRAYTHAPVLGEAFVFSRILGDASHLRHGVMYMLVHQTIASMRELYVRNGYPRWAFYDMFIGAKPGLREFKRRLGFKPHRVRWQWVDGKEGRPC
jgi:hypothetical protein